MTHSEPSPEAGSPARRDRLDEAFGVLETAVRERTVGERAPTASEVRLAMKRLTYDGFDPKQLGFKRFRDFLAAAESEGRVTVHGDRPGDIVVSVSGSRAPAPTFVRVRRDLWKAALDWSSSVDHYLDTEEDRVITLPTNAVPLEPEKFATVRSRLALGDESLVRVPSVDIRTQVGWMESFASALGDAQLKGLLLGALEGDKPAKLFTTVLRNEPAAQARWHHLLSANVLSHLQRWKEENPRIADVQIESAPRPSTESRGHQTPSSAATTASSRALVDAAGSIVMTVGSRVTSARQWRRPSTGAEDQLRALLHAAIDRMPEDELRSLRIPVGYLLGD